MATNFPGDTIIVVGGGLAGMSAANTALEKGAKVVLLDKSAFCGGNSTKATSGINGAGTKTQSALGIKDSAEIFLQDTMMGGAKKPKIAEVLCRNSAGDVDWLSDVFNLDLSLVARLGGHSQPRTHRGKERFPGMTITYALIQMLERACEKRPDLARLVTKAQVTKLITPPNDNRQVVGCEYKDLKTNKVFKEFGAVILASGGFGADFTPEGLLAKYRPDLTHLPTTSGEHCTGDAIKMAQAIKGRTIDLEWVQVHPTGLVNVKDPNAKVLFLAAEALRGVGGLVFDADGNRFANELGRRDYVTGEMWKNKAPFRLVLNKAASDEIIWHCKHYTGRNVMKRFESGADLAKEMGVPLQRLIDAHDQHYEASKKQEANPDGGPFNAYPSGKSWDKPSGNTGCGKKFFHNVIPGSQVASEPFYVAIITPVIHYCMGGLEISEKAEVLSQEGREGEVIKGLYAAGEVAGGVHGNNRLGGSSLLDCVVFGRVAAKAAADYMLGPRVKQTCLMDITGGGLGTGQDTVVVLGGGLAGMSAANTAIEYGAKVILLDKSAFCGGNSTKATSGINGAGTKTQKAQGIPDSAEIFLADTMKGGAKKPQIAQVLCANSAADVDWLTDVFALDLSLVARLGGHSQPRTHRGKERFPGMTITYALIQMLELIAEKTDKAQIITKAEANKLITNPRGDVIGVEYLKNGETHTAKGPVVFATGGFGADFTSNSLLAKHRPDLMHLPTTNGEHCTGDAIKMGLELGAKTIDLEWVQVHPTGLVNVKDPDAKVKFLAAEALRGVGGLVFDADGNRFANELGRRDYVTGEMWKNKGPFRLVLNKAASDEIIWHCKHYTGRNVMQRYESGAALAKDMGVPLQRLVDAHQQHYEASKKQEADPEGGPYNAYPSGKSWDKASGETGVGKKFFHNVIPGSAVANEPFYVAFITPVIHYCMGGLEISEKAEVLREKGGKINGLYAAGEVAGGVHGNNRLGGSSLLDCVVFGRVAGKAAAQYMLGGGTVATDLKKITGGGLSGNVQGSKLAGGSYEDNMNQKAGAAGGKAKKGAVAPAVGGGITIDEVAKHNTATDCWVVVNGQVLNVTNFLKDHPGGELAILTFAGKDASEEFNMIHPGDVIQKYAPDAIIGSLSTGAQPAAATDNANAPLLSKPAAQTMSAKPVYAGPPAQEEGESQISGYKGACFYMAWSFVAEIVYTIFSQKNFIITNDRTGLTRTAIFMIFFIVVHAIGNLHVFAGPNDFNGYGYFYVRTYLLVPANVIEIYLWFCLIIHAYVGLKRTYSIAGNYTLNSGKLNLFISGVLLLVFLCIHLVQFRFAETHYWPVRPPTYLVNLDLEDLLHLNFFWSRDTSIPQVMVRDIYRLEFELFQNWFWAVYYIFSVLVFVTHVNYGWEKVVPSTAFDIPKSLQPKVILAGKIIFWFIGLIYITFPIYCTFATPVTKTGP